MIRKDWKYLINQILYLQNSKNTISDSHDNSTSKNKKYYIIFISSILFTVFLFIYVFVHVRGLIKSDLKSKKLAQSFTISTLYNNNNIYSTSLSNITSTEHFIIGIIEIEKLSLHYPILSHSSEELLKISPCRFAGPMPNEVR